VEEEILHVMVRDVRDLDSYGESLEIPCMYIRYQILFFFKQEIEIIMMKNLVLHHRSFFHHMEIRVGTSVNLSMQARSCGQ
jgi:hypothetical protein